VDPLRHALALWELRSTQRILLLALTTGIGAYFAWLWRGRCQAAGLGLLVVVGPVLAYFIGLAIVVAIIISTGKGLH